MVAALKRAVRLRRTMRERDTRIEASGSAKACPLPLGETALIAARGLTARELIRMAQAARRARQD